MWISKADYNELLDELRDLNAQLSAIRSQNAASIRQNREMGELIQHSLNDLIQVVSGALRPKS